MKIARFVRIQFRMVEDDKKVSPEGNRPGSGTSVRFLTISFFGESGKSLIG